MNKDNRQGMRNHRHKNYERPLKYDSTMKTLCVSKIPAEYNMEEKVAEFFNKFGKIDHIIVKFNKVK